MIELILKMLEITNLKDDDVLFLKGKYKLAENLKEAKGKIKWQ